MRNLFENKYPDEIPLLFTTQANCIANYMYARHEAEIPAPLLSQANFIVICQFSKHQEEIPHFVRNDGPLYVIGACEELRQSRTSSHAPSITDPGHSERSEESRYIKQIQNRLTSHQTCFQGSSNQPP